MELHNGVATVCFNPASHSLKALEVAIVVRTQLTREANTAVLHRRGAGHGEPEPALCTTGQPMILIVAHNAVVTALQVGQCCQHKAIAEG